MVAHNIYPPLHLMALVALIARAPHWLFVVSFAVHLVGDIMLVKKEGFL
jgi:hypothetical protein